MKKHSFIRNLFKKMTIGKLLGISSIVLFFLGLFFAVNKIHGADFMRYIQIDVGLIDVSTHTKGPFQGAKFIIKDEYGNEYGYTSNENGIIEFCVDPDNGRCDLGFEDIGKIFYISEDCDGFDDYFSCNDEVVQVSIESDESGIPYARYFYIDEYGNQGSEVYFSAGDDEYIFLNGYRGMLKYKSIQVDVGQIDVSTDVKGPFANAKFIIKDEYGNEYGYVSDENGTIQFCIDSENDRCDLGYEDIGKIFYINEDCDEFDDFGDTFMCDKSVVKVSIESDEGGEPYARYFYIDDNLYPTQEVYPMPGVDNKYIFNNKKGDDKCVKIQTKVKSKVGNENFKFDLRDRWGSVIESEYSNENGEVEWSLCDGIDNRYFITQDCESLTHNGLLCDGSIVTVNINGESVEYHYDYYDGNMYDKIHPCFARNDEGEAVWGISYGDMSYYSFPQYSSRQSWEGGDWDNYANNNGGGITTGSYVRDPEYIDWAFYNSMMPVHLDLKPKVELDGAEIQSGMFNFKLTDYDSTISIASNNQSGDISFVNLNGDSYGLYEYSSCPYTLGGQDNTGENILGYDIDEYDVQGLLGGDTMTMQSYKISQGSKCSNFGYYICDDKEIQVEPQISCNSMDIGCKVKYSVDGGEYLPSDEVGLPSFLNKYHPTGTLDIKGKASGEGYEFLLVDTDTHMQIDSVYSDSEGHFGFEIEYDDEVIIGTHTYYIKSPLLACNTSYECSDTGMVTLTVNITDEGDGNLKIEPRYCIEDIGCSENLEDFIFTAPIEITARVRSKVGNAGFKFDLRNSEGTIVDSGYRSDANGFLSRKIYDRSNNLYFITQDCDEIVYPGLICDGSIVAVKIDGENIMYHFDTYDNMNQFLFDDNAYHDYDGAVEWGRRYADGRYYSIENSPSWQDWNDYGRNLYADYVESDTDNWTYEDTRPSNNRALDENSYSFYNKLRPVCVELKSKVELSGATLSSGMFDFSFDSYNDGSGDIWFYPSNLGWMETFNSYDFQGKCPGDVQLSCFNVENIADESTMINVGYYDTPVDLGTYHYEIFQGSKCEEYGYYECDTRMRQVDINLSCNRYGCSTDYSIDGNDYQYGDVIEIPKFVNEYKTIDLYVAVSNGDDLNGVDSISFDLLKNGTAFPTSYTVSKSSDWKMTITDLPKYDSNGTEIEYSIDLYEIPHYTGTILPVQQGESITFNVTLTGVIYTATFLPGQTVNLTLKSLATGTTVTRIYSGDTLIQQIVRTGGLAQGFATGLLSTTTSQVPIVAWYDNEILYYYTEADIIYLNQNSAYMFFKIQSGTYIDTSGWNTSNVTNMSSMFNDCRSLTSLDVSNWNTSNVTNMDSMFLNSTSLTSLDVSNWDTNKVTKMNSMFSSCRSLTELDVSNFVTSCVTNMSYMFNGCRNLTSLDVSNFDTSNVTSMVQMFQSCSSLTSLDVSNFVTSGVTNMSYMFRDCSSLTSLDVSSWDTSNVTNMGNMFNGCRNLTELDVSGWDTSKVTNMSYMFDNCRSLTSLDVSNFDTSNVTSMIQMFQSCNNLTRLDISSFDTSSVTNMQNMFRDCNNLAIIYASTGFITSGVTNSIYMFSSANKLVGGHGTKYNSSIVDKTRAVLDSESASGYLTYDIAVSYRTNTGVELARQIIDVGDTTVAPTIIRTGYAVSGWYTDTGLTTLFDFSQALRKYTELYVMWKCDTGYMLSGDGVTCIPLTYEVRHFIKNAGELSYTLSGTEIFTGIAGEQVYFDDLSQTYPSCIVYSRGSLTGDENGPGEIETKTDIAGDGSTVINLFYDRNTYTVDLSRDFGIGMVEGAGTYECGQEVQIRAYPIDGYHFDMWEGNVDD